MVKKNVTSAQTSHTRTRRFRFLSRMVFATGFVLVKAWRFPTQIYNSRAKAFLNTVQIIQTRFHQVQICVLKIRVKSHSLFSQDIIY